jgi:hypothetical protein
MPLVSRLSSKLLLALALIAARPVSAEERPSQPNLAARCALKVVNALPGDGGIDPRITRLRPYLQQPPYTYWRTFKLLSEKEAELVPGASASYPLPNGRSATVTYTQHATAPDGKHLVRGVFHVDGPRATARTTFSLDEGGLFMVAGEKHAGGILIYSLSCKTED